MHSIRYSLTLACLIGCIAAQGCARIVERDPTRAQGASAQAKSNIAYRAPDGAECGARVVVDESDDGACDTGTPPWAAWTDQRPPGVCYVVDEPCDGVSDHVAYLTFDDGPSDWTAEFLEILAKQNVKATFFINTRGIKGPPGLDGSYRDDDNHTVRYSQILKRTVDDGHVIGNHTTDHPDLGTLTEDEIWQQLQENERLINRALLQEGGHVQPLTLLRAPFGSPWFAEDRMLDDIPTRQTEAGRVFRQFGYNVLWNISATDADEWAQGEAPTKVVLARDDSDSTVTFEEKKDRILNTVLNHPLVQAGKGIVILMHDTHNATRDVLSAMIDGLRARGYRFETLEQQVVEQYGRPSLDLTPGPAMNQHCGVERSRSCLGGDDPTTPSVCGRMWRAFRDLGGDDALGRPASERYRQSQTQIVAQTYAGGTLELHPELDEPCDSLWLPAP